MGGETNSASFGLAVVTFEKYVLAVAKIIETDKNSMG